MGDGRKGKEKDMVAARKKGGGKIRRKDMEMMAKRSM